MGEPLREIPSKRDRAKVDDTLKTVMEQQFDEVVVLGIKDGRSYLHHSKIENTLTLVGVLESIKHRLLEK